MLLMQEAKLMLMVQIINKVCQLITDIAVIIQDPVHLEKVIGIHVVRARARGRGLTFKCALLPLTVKHAVTLFRIEIQHVSFFFSFMQCSVCSVVKLRTLERVDVWRVIKSNAGSLSLQLRAKRERDWGGWVACTALVCLAGPDN